jgi:putative DNA primase/helicase
VIFDEADSETAKSSARIQNVLALMRQASSETGAAIYKGSALGDSVAYRTRSCFGFSSIGVGLQQHADQTRVSVLTLTLDNSIDRSHIRERFRKIEAAQLEILTPEYVDRLHARTISLIPVIRRNAETFAVAGASVIGTRRLGDQLGALIAGAFSLTSRAEISLVAAEAWLREQDWTEETTVMEDKDEIACVRTIMQAVVSAAIPDGRNVVRVDKSISELIELAADAKMDPLIKQRDARDALIRVGIKVEASEGVTKIANNHTGLKRILALTPWVSNWGRILRRIEGASAGPPERFAGPPDRVTVIPTHRLFGE